MKYPNILSNLIDCFKHLPGVGEKTAERLAFAAMELDESVIETFADSLKNVKQKLTRCKQCNTLSEFDTCLICSDKQRNNTICVVEDVKNVFLLEALGSYHGRYFVLNHLISPMDGINPEDVNINQLLNLVEENNIEEVILAIKPCLEGETTTLYISKMLEGLPVTVSRIAQGIPIGAEMSYIDTMTLETALEDRKKIS